MHPEYRPALLDEISNRQHTIWSLSNILVRGWSNNYCLSVCNCKSHMGLAISYFAGQQSVTILLELSVNDVVTPVNILPKISSKYYTFHPLPTIWKVKLSTSSYWTFRRFWQMQGLISSKNIHQCYKVVHSSCSLLFQLIQFYPVVPTDTQNSLSLGSSCPLKIR